MTGEENAQLCALLDNVWGGVDEGREAGYLTVLAELPYELVMEAVQQFAHGVDRKPEDLKWVPRAPEIWARAARIQRQRDTQARFEARVARLELEPVDQPPGGTP